MKKVFVLVWFLIFACFSFGQKFGYVNTEYILSNIDKYRSAQDQLDLISVEWQKEIEAKFAEIDRLYKEFQAEKVLLTEEMRAKREGEIIKKEKEAKDLQKKYFGKDGDLFKKRQELVKPIQDEVFNAVKELATEGNYAVIFDAAGSLNMLYTDPKYDRSDDVLKKMGYKN